MTETLQQKVMRLESDKRYLESENRLLRDWLAQEKRSTNAWQFMATSLMDTPFPVVLDPVVGAT
jgi:hypothetical protein